VLINISHENTTWCELLLHQRLTVPVVSSLIATSLHASHGEGAGERDGQEFDRLCLALGLLTNLVQVNEESKDLCRETSTLLLPRGSLCALNPLQNSILHVRPSVNARTGAAVPTLSMSYNALFLSMNSTFEQRTTILAPVSYVATLRCCLAC
jgi:hypothetical protein